MNPPEGFEPYELKTSFGTLTLPDRRCAVCIARWKFFSCTACYFTQTLMEDAKPILDEMMKELNKNGL